MSTTPMVRYWSDWCRGARSIHLGAWHLRQAILARLAAICWLGISATGGSTHLILNKRCFLGQLDSNGIPITIEGLWGLRFGNCGNGGVTDELFYRLFLVLEAR
jgi:hypothetical protein